MRMFDNMTIYKAHKIRDNINNNEVEVCTFNATLNSQSGIMMNMNINYPNIYMNDKDNILLEYRKFVSDVTALATTMGLATSIDTNPSILDNLDNVRGELAGIAKEVFNNVIASLGDITVNPVPIVDVSAPTQPYPGAMPNFPNNMR